MGIRDRFERTRRDFSHGCIRVEDPVALATFVLQGMPGWDEARIRAAMSAGRSSTLRLAPPVPVLITYGPCLLYTSPSPRYRTRARMPSSA